MRLALKGSLKVGSEPTEHKAFHTLVLSGDKHETGVQLTSLDHNTEAIVVRTYLKEVHTAVILTCMYRLPASRLIRPSSNMGHL